MEMPREWNKDGSLVEKVVPTPEQIRAVLSMVGRMSYTQRRLIIMAFGLDHEFHNQAAIARYVEEAELPGDGSAVPKALAEITELLETAVWR